MLVEKGSQNIFSSRTLLQWIKQNKKQRFIRPPIFCFISETADPVFNYVININTTFSSKRSSPDTGLSNERRSLATSRAKEGMFPSRSFVHR